jgi:hypothetical protein
LAAVELLAGVLDVPLSRGVCAQSSAADKNQRQIELQQAAHEAQRTQAAVQLERVRSQVADALAPMMGALSLSLNHERCIWKELELPIMERLGIQFGSLVQENPG